MSTEDSNQEQEVKDVSTVPLPSWLIEQLPEHLPHWVISYDEGTFWVTSDDTAASFPTVLDAYNYVSEFSDEVQVEFDASVDGQGGELFDVTFLCKSVDGYSRFLSGYVTEEIVKDLEETYNTFLNETSPEYRADPDNFLKAWAWLSNHPVFWIKGTKEKHFHWATDSGLDRMRINIWPDEGTQKPVVFLEHGPHHEDGYDHYYHDVRLFVKAETFEEAVVALAKKVDTFYGLDGVELVKKVSE